VRSHISSPLLVDHITPFLLALGGSKVDSLIHSFQPTRQHSFQNILEYSTCIFSCKIHLGTAFGAWRLLSFESLTRKEHRYRSIKPCRTRKTTVNDGVLPAAIRVWLFSISEGRLYIGRRHTGIAKKSLICEQTSHTFRLYVCIVVKRAMQGLSETIICHKNHGGCGIPIKFCGNN